MFYVMEIELFTSNLCKYVRKREKRVCFHSSLENDRLAPIGAKMKYEGGNGELLGGLQHVKTHL